MAMTERQMELRIGALVLVGILLFVGFVVSIGKRSTLFEERYSLWSSFSSTEGLAVGSPVRLAGVTVGNVTKIAFARDPRERRIAVTITVERRVQDRIREDSVAGIGTIGLVGDKVLDITVGSYDRPALQAGGQLASVDPPDYFRLLQKGDRILDNVTRITASLDEFLAGGEQAGKRNMADSIRSLRTTLVEIEKGQGLLHDLVYGKEGAELLGRVDRTAKALEHMVQAVETERGLLHALIYTPQEETLGRLTRLADNLNQTVDRANGILRAAQEEPGLLHALIYDREAGKLVDRLSRTSERLETLVQSIQEGQGLVPALLFDPERTKVLDDVQKAAAGLRAVTEDLQAVTARLRQGEGTVGALLEDPTVYEDLSALLRGANRSLLLRSLIRSTREDGLQEKKP
jgi:phospholipid/cholesterol/gamma-HCH transport system substrate-binding protein